MNAVDSRGGFACFVRSGFLLQVSIDVSHCSGYVLLISEFLLSLFVLKIQSFVRPALFFYQKLDFTDLNFKLLLEVLTGTMSIRLRRGRRLDFDP